METLVRVKSKDKQYVDRIKNVLRDYFPTTDFVIRISEQNYCTVVNVSYTDGVSDSRVRDAVRVFNRQANPSINFKGIKINLQRAMSDNVKSILLHEIKSIFKMKQLPKESDYFEPVKGEVSDYMKMIFKMRDFD